ncbi:kunitz-like toxin PcKuz3 [Zeugodacus cucurbitae]|uniref:kunitz-like toxin PcKuz3 n=1 Tax=Zeugodacus cucurbitae TaxID=28588 RepID=UPI0005969B25|nr:kunitz-like toxin PcKuz3 [Zeugodacus cucurbitae]
MKLSILLFFGAIVIASATDYCGPPLDLCSQPINPGISGGGCRGQIAWGYNQNTQSCQRFVYNGSGGNLNRFTTWRACRRSCRCL